MLAKLFPAQGFDAQRSAFQVAVSLIEYVIIRQHEILMPDYIILTDNTVCN